VLILHAQVTTSFNHSVVKEFQMPITLLNLYVEFIEGSTLRHQDLVEPIRAHAATLGVSASVVLTNLQSMYFYL
jgi:hypothetical protein